MWSQEDQALWAGCDGPCIVKQARVLGVDLVQQERARLRQFEKSEMMMAQSRNSCSQDCIRKFLS